jgi:hypothetical protein
MNLAQIIFFLLKTEYGGRSPVIAGGPEVPRIVDAELEINALRSKQKQSRIYMNNFQLPASIGTYGC